MSDSVRSLVEHTNRHWQSRCLTCGTIFDLPGIRVGATGRPVKILRCPACARWRCCRVEPRETTATGDAGTQG